MTTDDVIRLMKEARTQRLLEFSWGELHFKLGTLEEEISVPDNPNNRNESLLDMEAQVKQDQLENLRLSDPLAYEQLILTDKDGESA